MNTHIDKNIGVSGAKVYWMHSKCGKYYWCRMAIAIMGTFNMTPWYIKNTSPFDTDYQENYVEGKGKTKDEAFSNMEQDMKGIADSLWAV